MVTYVSDTFRGSVDWVRASLNQAFAFQMAVLRQSTSDNLRFRHFSWIGRLGLCEFKSSVHVSNDGFEVQYER